VGDDHPDTVACIPFIKVESRRVNLVVTIIERSKMSITQGLTDIFCAFCLELDVVNKVIGKWK
jgi:hypothetical protein